MKSPIVLLSLLPLSTRAFVAPSSHRRPLQSSESSPSCPTVVDTNGCSTTQLSAKKKNRNASSGEGFGKFTASTASAIRDEPAELAEAAAPRALQSIESPTSPTTSPAEDLNLDPNLSEEERSQAILRQKFGLKSFEEQQADIGDYRAVLDAEKKKSQRDKLRNIEELWPEDKSVLEVLPPGVIKGIDSFLKLGLGLSTVVFVLAGVMITIEAGSKATGYELPAGLEPWIENVVEPNFTPGLGVLLGFSVSLGLFTVGLGSGASSTYREDP